MQTKLIEEAETCKTLEDLIGLHGRLFDKERKWIFRGEKRKWSDTRGGRLLRKSYDEAFQTHLEKAFRKFGVKEEERRAIERGMIRKFQRDASLYIEHVPRENDILEWLSLMRHWDAPVRLLDWQYSFAGAIYFAVNDLNCTDEVGEVWALNRESVGWERLKERISREGNVNNFARELRCLFNRLKREKDVNQFNEDKINDNAIISALMKHPISLVYNVTPFKRNRRLTSQQGTFLLQGDINKSFMNNLEEMAKDDSKPRLYRICIQVTKQERNTLLNELHDMNIKQTALFPDLSGLAASLRHYMAYPGKLGIEAPPTDGSLRALFSNNTIPETDS